MRKGHHLRDPYGPLDLDPEGAHILQRFVQCAYREWLDGTPIPKKLEPYPFQDFRSKLWWRMHKMYEEGSLVFELTLFDQVSDRPPPDLSKLTNRFSKEV